MLGCYARRAECEALLENAGGTTMMRDGTCGSNLIGDRTFLANWHRNGETSVFGQYHLLSLASTSSARLRGSANGPSSKGPDAQGRTDVLVSMPWGRAHASRSARGTMRSRCRPHPSRHTTKAPPGACQWISSARLGIVG